MRTILHATFPHDPFNTYIKKGTIAQKLNEYLEGIKPEAAYFTEIDGKRTALLVINIENPSQIPFYAEPLFLQFNADVQFHPAMTPGDLKESGLESLGKKWA